MRMTYRRAQVRRAVVVALLLGTSACSGAPRAVATAVVPMAAPAMLEANKAVVRRFYTALNAGDYAAADTLIAPNYRHHAVTADTGFRAYSWSAFKTGNAGAKRAFPDWELTIQTLVAEGEYVVALVAGRGTHRGAYSGVQPTGRTARAPLMMMHQVRNGRIVADWELVNLEPMTRALREGAPP